jgi:cellulose synthase operon protein C
MDDSPRLPGTTSQKDHLPDVHPPRSGPLDQAGRAPSKPVKDRTAALPSRSRFDMRRLIPIVLLVLSLPALAQQRKEAKDQKLEKATSAAPDKSLAGDITRKKTESTELAPALQYDHFRLGVELQVASKRRQQITDLKKIIELTDEKAKERPDLLFRLGELYFEESKYFFYEANRKDDDYIRAMNAGDKAGQESAKKEKEGLTVKSKEFARLATERYAEIVKRFPEYKRSDEVLYFLGHNLMEAGDEKRALVAYKRLIDKYSKGANASKFLPDAYLAFGEYHFANSKGKPDQLNKALEYYRLAEGFPQNQAYAFAIYKQGWCYFNLADYEKAMDKFKAVILYGEFAGAEAVDKDGGKSAKSGKSTLIREARSDYVKAFARSTRSASDARVSFARIAKQDEDQWKMLKQLANLYYEDGKDKEAALTFNGLIQRRPRSPEAPGFQGKIVDCVLRAGNKKMTVDQVRRLVKIHDDVVKSGAIKDDKDKKAMDEARELSERTISNLAVNWHNEGKKTRDQETFQFANEVYSDYLTLFPDNKKAYDLRFFWAELLNDNLQRYDKAAEQYTLALMQDVARVEKKEKPGKWMANAAYNSVLAWDEVVKAAEQKGTLKPPDVSDAKKKAAIAPQRKALLEACDRYLKYLPEGDKRVEIAFKAANIYYRHNYFDEAVKAFADIALNHQDFKFETGERASEMAANLIIDIYNVSGDWAKMNEWARKFYNDPKLASGKFRDELSGYIEQSAFKLVNQLEAQKDYAKAAEAYLAFVAEFPKSAIAEKALFNASIDFYTAKMMDRAIEVRKRLVSQYPNSEFVPACLYANAEVAEAIGDFEVAADWYEQYVRGYEKSLGGGAKRQAAKPKPQKAEAKGDPAKPGDKPPAGKPIWEESKAQIALFNAGVFREGLGQYKQALKNREHYLELWPNSKDADAVFLSIADLHEKNGAHSKAIKQLEEYEKNNLKEPNKFLMAEGRITQIYEDKLRRPKEARRVYTRIWEHYEKLAPKQKKSLDNAALDAVARAHFVLSDEAWNDYAKLKLRWGRGNAMAQEFKHTLQDKAKALETVQKRYTQTVAFKSGDPAICALYQIGMAYHQMVDAVVNAPMPAGAPPELQDAIRAELAGQAQPIKDKAAEAFAATVAKGQELDIFNQCFAKSLALLRETYRPQQFPPMPEEALELKASGPEMSVGGGVVTSIQAVPVVTDSQAKEAKQKADELGKQVSDVRGASGSAPKADLAEEKEPEPRPAKGKAKKRNNTDEPEDSL